MKQGILKLLSTSALIFCGTHAIAKEHEVAALFVQSSGDLETPGDIKTSDNLKFAKFAPKDNPRATKVDYDIWDQALKYMVFHMGRSIRESAPSPEAGLNSRLLYGHRSRYRLEGNRITFSFLNKEILEALSVYRQDLEAVGNGIDISKLTKNEQLAYWMNLHNVAVIEQIAIAYPLKHPYKVKIDGQPLDEAKFISVSGVSMSPRDIRNNIVYKYWKDPKVIYGFFRGEIGGPTIQSKAFTGENVSILLNNNATEFVNSLRGVQKSGGKLLVSKIYEDARPYFFANWFEDLNVHLLKYANDDVQKIIAKTNRVKTNIYESAISDLAYGERKPDYGFVTGGNQAEVAGGITIPSNIVRLLGEHQQKVVKLIRRSVRQGTVTVGGEESEEPISEEVE